MSNSTELFNRLTTLLPPQLAYELMNDSGVFLANTDGTRTPYPSLAAVPTPKSGQAIILGIGTYDLGDSGLNLSGDGTGGAHLFGAGRDATVITSTRSSTVGAIVKPGAGSNISGLTIWGTKTDGTFQCPLGAITATGEAAFTGVFVSNVSIIADSDGILYGSGSTAHSMTCDKVVIATKFDAIAITGSGASLTFNNSSAISSGSTATATPARAAGAFLVSSATLNARNSVFGGTDGTGGGDAFGISCTVSSIANVDLCTFVTSNGGGGNAYDVSRTGGTLTVGPGCKGSGTGGALQTNGTITYSALTQNIQSHIADPSGGSTTDAEARAAINSILNALEAQGILATS